MRKHKRELLLLLIIGAIINIPISTAQINYEQRGVGGGGAMSSFSMSPYSDLWFVGTDMGHLYRSTDAGVNWKAVSHFETTFSADLPNACYVGFNPDVNIVFHAYEGCKPQRSTDGGVTWTTITSLQNLLPTTGYDYADCKNDNNKTRIRYWLSNSIDGNIVLAASGDGLFRSADRGINWTKVATVSGESKGTVWDYSTTPHTVYHANETEILRSTDAGLTFSTYHTANVRSFTGGRDANGLRLAFLENDDTECTGGYITNTCGKVWTELDGGGFSETTQLGGDWVRMAENNSSIIYTTGARNWGYGYGTQIWVSQDGGANWDRKLWQLQVDATPFKPWDLNNFEWSAVGLDVGYDDGGYRSFSVNRTNAAQAGGTGNYFLHVTRNYGDYWEAPFTEIANGEPQEQAAWQSTGLEPTSAWLLEFHPNNPQVGYVGFADIGGLCTEDGGQTWRIIKNGYNSIYDHAFNPADDDMVFAAMSSQHDFPYNHFGNYTFGAIGGIFKSADRGHNWVQLTPSTGDFHTAFLSVAYDEVNNIIYGGTQGRGVAVSNDNGLTWAWLNDGLGSQPKIVPQIEIDPVNQDVYIIMSGDKPDFTDITQTGIYKLSQGGSTWSLLRGTVVSPGTDGVNYLGPLWKFPVHFAIDWTDANRQKIWMADNQIPGMYRAAGLWLTTDGGTTWNRKLEAPFVHRITLDPCDANMIYASALGGNATLSGGSFYSSDGGNTWQLNTDLPMQNNVSACTIDPNDASKIFYTCFGGGIWYGDKPAGATCSIPIPNPISSTPKTYEQRGVGGGGAMSGFSISPYSDLRFVGTDMGHLYRSTDKGDTWRAVSHFETRFSSDLPNACYVGFNPDVNIVFHAFEGCKPQRSEDGGITWSTITDLQAQLPTGGYDYADCKNDNNKTRIRYWLSNSMDGNIVLAASGDGLFRSADKGVTWTKIATVTGESKGTVWDYSTTPHTVYHANETGILRSTDAGLTFSTYHTANIRSFTGGRDGNGLRLTFIEDDDTDCTGGNIDEDCGNIWIELNGSGFVETAQVGGDWVRMAENNSQTIYVTGSRTWNLGEGTRIWVSKDGGATWTLKLWQLKVDGLPYVPWDKNYLEWSAVGLDIGYDDGGYRSFSINRRDATEAGGTGNYFLHTTQDEGEHWLAPFTDYADTGDRDTDKKWQSKGLEPTSAWHLEFHPNNPQIGYVGYADIGGLCTEDGGQTWRIIQTDYNSNYDHAFDPNDDQIVYAAVSSKHDFPYNWYGNVDLTSPGGIYKSIDRGKNWTRLTASSGDYNTPFLAVAYDAVNNILYGGTQGRGICQSTDGGMTWTWINTGLGSYDKIITQIEIDPNNQDVYILLSGNRPDFTNIAETGIYKLTQGNSIWTHLRGTVHDPNHSFIGPLWKYPVHFAMDWRSTNRDIIWMTDIRNYGSYKAAGVWQTTDGGTNWYQRKESANPHRITLDPCDENVIYVNGLDGGEDRPYSSGSMFTTDGGITWKYNKDLPMHYNLTSLTIDPNDPTKVFYTSFGGGMWYGEKPLKSPVNCNVAEVLPVHLISFQGICEGNQVQLTWQTASEQNNFGFYVEKQIKNEWIEIGFVEGNGTTLERSNYTYIDTKFEKEKTYYRLKQVDNDGQFEYSNIITVDCAKALVPMNIFPNPTTREVHITFEQPISTTIEIWNVLGQNVLQQTIDEQMAVDLNLQSLPNGVYFLKVNGVVRQIVKQ